MRRRIPELDAIRGLAALLVVLYHYTVRYDLKVGFDTAPLFRVPFGHWGVEAFFLLSGFVIFMTLAKTERGVDFVVSRASRLYPGYWVGAGLTLAAVALFGAPFDGYTLATSDVLANVTMLQRYVPSAVNIDGVYWTLGVELTFYALIFGLFLAGQLQRVRTAIVVLLVAALGLHVATSGGDIGAPLVLRVLRKLTLEHYAPYFAAGILFYQLREHGPRKGDLGLLGLCLAVACFLHPGPDALASVVCYLLFGLLVAGRLHWLATRPLLFLGAISYSLYVVHQNIGYLVIRHTTDLGLETNLAILAALTVSALLATAITFWVERPAQRLVRSWFRRERTPRATLASPVEPQPAPSPRVGMTERASS